jgi:hypothetical protein
MRRTRIDETGPSLLATRTIFAFFIAAFPAILPVQSQGPKATAATLYFVNSDEKWCVYSKESEWRSEMVAGDTVGTIEYVGRRVSRIRVTTPDDPGAGDWMVFDIYSLDRNEQLHFLERTINVLPGNISQLETWHIENGKAVRQSSISRDLDTLKPKREPEDWVPELPVFTSPTEIPVWPLFRHREKSLTTTGKACVTITRPPPTPPPTPPPVKSWSTYVDARFGWSVEYPSTWTIHNSCPVGCPAPGDAVIFSNPNTKNSVIVSSLTDPLAGRNVDERLAELKGTNVNAQISETQIRLGNLKALTVRYEQPNLQMETTYVVTESAHFDINISSVHWTIEQLTEYLAYRHLLESFAVSK